ncbi:MAG TPA: efflux RND transporter periplasmic adaptor subunit [Anaerohalosphaeraceae bacterium]|nr:efflux RND transporter periplasmic adaptor subunit [Anaerohalosphaeraceae bacterium]HPC65557.1 efflux RND transporter periplasmic adaptor subunit [Anaerohalosphaeraceae bacterium]HRS72749.1 efflux RND transporter periplasmic adaptor subunit [Anaerohalosphaeraceae bacterium]HRV20975.1 efflux RND transporter periplasmic adaptor subunit [Anaerohalosphaeraceae bacterium]
MKGKQIIIVLIVVAVAAGIFLMRRKSSSQPAPAAQAAGPLPMPAARCVMRDVTDYYEFTGTTEAVDAVDIRARVEGYLKGIHFTDGQIVEEGQLLFTIEPEAFAARRDEAAAQLKAAQAESERAWVDLQRIQNAIASNAVSQQDLTRSRAVYETAAAAVLAAQARLADAQLNLSYTEIRSPIRGRIGRHMADIGNLVGPASRPVLTTVMRMQPMYVSFYMGEHLLKGGLLQRLQGGGQPLAMLVGLPDEKGYPHEGTIGFLDNRVDAKTGTVYVRGQLPNQDETLLPGMFVRIRLPIAQRPNAVLIPEKAILTDLGGKYVLAVGQGNVLERRSITLGASVDGMRVVTEGLDGSEMFIVGSFHMARPGMPVTPLTGDGPPAGMPAGQAAPSASNLPADQQEKQ